MQQWIHADEFLLDFSKSLCELKFNAANAMTNNSKFNVILLPPHTSFGVRFLFKVNCLTWLPWRRIAFVCNAQIEGLIYSFFVFFLFCFSFEYCDKHVSDRSKESSSETINALNKMHLSCLTHTPVAHIICFDLNQPVKLQAHIFTFLWKNQHAKRPIEHTSRCNKTQEKRNVKRTQQEKRWWRQRWWRTKCTWPK